MFAQILLVMVYLLLIVGGGMLTSVLVSNSSLLLGKVENVMGFFFCIKSVVLHSRSVLLGRAEPSQAKDGVTSKNYQDPNGFKGQKSLGEGPTAPSPRK